MPFLRVVACIFATLAIALLAIGLAVGIPRTQVFVVNQSGVTLNNLVISGAFKERHFANLATLSEWRAVTLFRSGGTIQLSFVNNGKRYTAEQNIPTNYVGPAVTYFIVDSNLVVKTETRH